MAWLRKGRLMSDNNKTRRNSGKAPGGKPGRDHDVADDATGTPGTQPASERDSRGAAAATGSGVEGVHSDDMGSAGANRDSRTN